MRQLQRLRRLLPSGRYDPAVYWERRAEELIRTYDSPEVWDTRGWLRYEVEEQLVPMLLGARGLRTVLVVGAGSGRQYDYLLSGGFEPAGLDISPRLVEECATRFPDVHTEIGDLLGAEQWLAPHDAVLATAVLQHISPSSIRDAVTACRSLARELVVIREQTRRADPSPYQWAHDYPALFAPWQPAHREVTDDDGRTEVTLFAFVPPDAGITAGE